MSQWGEMQGHALWQKDPRRVYWIGELPLKVTEKEKDLGVIISSNGKMGDQAVTAANKASRILGVMRKTFRYFDMKLFKMMYPTFVRPHLEFASAVWNSLSVKDAKRLEGVQRRATKMVTELRGMSYEMRLKKLGLTSLETRRKRGDLIQIYKIIKGLEEVDWGMNIGRNRPELAHRYQIQSESCGKCTLRGDFLPNRTATTWNLLPSVVVIGRQLMDTRRDYTGLLRQVFCVGLYTKARKDTVLSRFSAAL